VSRSPERSVGGAWRSRRLPEIAAQPAGVRNDPSNRAPGLLSLDSGNMVLQPPGKWCMVPLTAAVT